MIEEYSTVPDRLGAEQLEIFEEGMIDTIAADGILKQDPLPWSK